MLFSFGCWCCIGYDVSDGIDVMIGNVVLLVSVYFVVKTKLGTESERKAESPKIILRPTTLPPESPKSKKYVFFSV